MTLCLVMLLNFIFFRSGISSLLYQRNPEILFLIPYQFGKPNCVQVFLFPNLDIFPENHAIKYLGDTFLRFSKKNVA